MTTRAVAPLRFVLFTSSRVWHRKSLIAPAVLGMFLAPALVARTAAEDVRLPSETTDVVDVTELATSALGDVGLKDTGLETAALVAAEQSDPASRWAAMPLVLNGRGTRNSYRRIVIRDVAFRVYGAELYVPEPTGDSQQIIYEYPNVELRFQFHRNVSSAQLRQSAAASFGKLLPDSQQRRAHADNCERFINLMASDGVHKGDRVVLRFSNDSVEVLLNGKRRGAIEGRDFQQLARRIWLDEPMPDRGLTELREELLNHRAIIGRAATTSTASARGQ